MPAHLPGLRPPRPSRPGLVAGAMVSVIACGLLAVLVLATFLDSRLVLPAIGVAAGILLICVIGPEKAGLLALLGAYFTAPSYKGLAPSAGSIVTPTDLLFVAGFTLLAPTLLGRRLRLSTPYLLGVLLIVITGCLASALSVTPMPSFLLLGFWITAMFVLPVAIKWWSPDQRIVDLLAWAYVAGQVLSTLKGLADGPVALGRYVGLNVQPNYFAQAGMLSVALLFYLAYRSRKPLYLLAVWGSLAICGTSVVLSGSRAATLVTAVLVLMVPFVERAAREVYLVALGGALALAAGAFLMGGVNPDSSLGRLAGLGGAAQSNAERQLGFVSGLGRFLDNPILGGGFIDLYGIHSNYLEVAVSIGIFGLLGYLLVLFALAKGIMGTSPYRRFGYAVFAYIGFGATIPSLYDRSIWAVVALAILASVSAREHQPTSTSDNTSRPDAGIHPRHLNPVAPGGTS